MSHKNTNKRSSKKKSRTNRSTRTQPYRLGNVDLPQINNKPLQTRCFRFYSAPNDLATECVVTSAHILRIMGTTVSGTTAFTPIIEGFYLRRVGVHTIGGTTTGSVAFSWRGANVPQTREVMFVGTGVPASRSHYPPEESSVGWWYDDTATVSDMFSLIATGNGTTYLDLEIAYVIADGARAPIALTGNANLTGVQYFSFPDTTRVFVADQLNDVHV